MGMMDTMYVLSVQVIGLGILASGLHWGGV